MGYDIWMGNNRGTQYSQGHETLSTDDQAYWQFSWAEMGLHDGRANIKEIKHHTGVQKIFYLGYSQGTVQMFYGLAHLEDTFYAKHLHKMVALAPCFVAEDLLCPDLYSENSFSEKGIYNFYGPNWEENLKKICSDYSAELCDHYTNTSG